MEFIIVLVRESFLFISQNFSPPSIRLKKEAFPLTTSMGMGQYSSFCKNIGNEVVLMNDYHERLTKILLEKNEHITYEQALTWVELLWEDFEATYAKAGHEYAGEEMTSRVVRTWIDNYGEQFHEFIAKNPKYQQLLNQQNRVH